MADKTNTVQLIIEGNNVTAIKSIDGVETKLKGLGNSTTSIGGKMGNIFGSMGSQLALGATAAVAGFGYMIKEAINLGDELNDMSKRSGVSVESLSTLKYAAEISGSSFDGLGTSLKFLNKNLYEASTGNKELSSAFNALGVPAKDAAGNITSADQALYKIADKFKSMPDGVEKTALSLKVFGRSGTEIIPMLNDGSEGLIKMQQEAEKLGLQMSTKTAQDMDAFNDNLARIEGSAQGAAISLVSAFGPTVVSLLDNFASGLDVIFGKTELINGIQFKEAALSVAQIDAYTKGLIGTSIEWRAEQVKVLEQQKAIAEVAAISAQAELEKFDNMAYGAGILTKLFTDEDNQLEQRARENKIEVNDLKQKIDLLKSFGTVSSKNNFVDAAASDAAKKKMEDLVKLQNDLRFKIDTIGIDKTNLALMNLGKEMDALRSKGVAEPLLAEYFSKSQNNILKELNKTISAQTSFMPNMPQLILTPEMDVTKFLAAKAIMEQGITDVAFTSQLNFEVMSGYGSEAFGSMADALGQFYELSGNKSKELFIMNKAFAIGQAVMNTYEGATKAIGQGGIFGPIMAAAVIAAGLANVAKIASTQPGSTGGGGGSSMSSVSIPKAPITSNQTTNNNKSNVNSISININSQVLAGTDMDKWVRDNLAPSISKAVNDGILDFGGNE